MTPITALATAALLMYLVVLPLVAAVAAAGVLLSLAVTAVDRFRARRRARRAARAWTADELLADQPVEVLSPSQVRAVCEALYALDATEVRR